MGGGGGGVQSRRPENSLNNGFFSFLFLSFSPQLILQFTEGGPMVLLQRKLYFSKDRGGPTFSRGGGGVQGVNFYRNPYKL